MFNPADFDALRVQLEKKYLEAPTTIDNMDEYGFLRHAVATTRHLAESFGLMAPEPAPIRPCQECGATPVNSPYSRLCEACYAIACEEIRAELEQKGAAE